MAKEIFRTAYTGRERNTTETGRPMADLYEHQIDNKGVKLLVKVGETNLYEKIQSHIEETNISNIIARVTQGDTSMLRANGVYADLTALPKNMLEARQAMQMMENVWKSLDNEIKKKYNFSVDEFIAASNTKEWLVDMGYIKEDAKPEIKIEAKTEEKKEVEA